MYNSHGLLYTWRMSKMDVSTARARLPELLELARTEAIYLERYGKAAAVVISPERHEELLSALEELEDAQAFDDAMAEEGENIPWEQVKADLGWS